MMLLLLPGASQWTYSHRSSSCRSSLKSLLCHVASVAFLLSLTSVPNCSSQTPQPAEATMPPAVQLSTPAPVVTKTPPITPGCTKPSSPDNGTHHPPAGPYRVGDVIRYRCSAGHLLLGARQRVCREVTTATKLPAPVINATNVSTIARPLLDSVPAISVKAEWTGQAPLCIVSACGDPGVPEFGFRIGDGTAYSAVVQFGCPPGYLLNGDTVSRCLYNGKTTAWSHPKPTCTPVPCPSPKPGSNALLLNSSLQNGTYAFGDRVQVICKEGFGFIGQHYGHDVGVMRCEANGEWSMSAYVCQKIECPSLGDLANGYFQFSKTYPSAGSIVTYGCGSQYELNGSVSRVCQSNGTWSGEPTTCKRMICEDLPPPQNGRWSSVVAFVGEGVKLVCDFGYSRKGSGMVQCGSDRRWYGVESECVSDFVWDPKAGDLTETEPTKDSASKAPDATSDKADKVIFGFPMKMIVIVGCGVLAILLVIVGLIWLRRRQRRRTRERELDEKSGDVQSNVLALGLDTTLMSMMNSEEKPVMGTESLIIQNHNHARLACKTSTLSTTCPSSGEKILPPPPTCPRPVTDTTGEVYDQLAESPNKLKQVSGKLVYDDNIDDDYNVVLATRRELEYDIPVVDSCDEDVGLYDDAMMTANFYMEANSHVHVYDSANEGGNCSQDFSEGIYTDVNTNQDHPVYTAPPDLDEIYSDLADETIIQGLRLQIGGPHKNNFSPDEDYNEPSDRLPPPPEGGGPVSSALATRRSSRLQRRKSKAKSLVTDSFRRILKNKRRRISVGSSYDVAMTPGPDYAGEPNHSATRVPGTQGVSDEYKVPFDDMKNQQLAGVNEAEYADYHQPIDKVVDKDSVSQHYYRQPIDSLRRGQSTHDSLLKQVDSQVPAFPPPPPCPVGDQGFNTLPRGNTLPPPPPPAGLEYSSALILQSGPRKPPRQQAISDTEAGVSRQSAPAIRNNPTKSTSAAGTAGRRKPKPVVPEKPPHVITMNNRTAPHSEPPKRSSCIIADSGDVYSVPEK